MKARIIIISLFYSAISVTISCKTETVSTDDCGEEIIQSNQEEPLSQKRDTLKETQTDTSANTDLSDSSLHSKKSSVHKQTIKVKQDSVVNVEEAVNVPALTDPRMDPDYIGTPCKYVDGECIRHDHEK